MSQVEGPAGAENQGKTQGNEGIKRTQEKTGKNDLDPNPHGGKLPGNETNIFGGKGRGKAMDINQGIN
jgi:hypothetical protein